MEKFKTVLCLLLLLFINFAFAVKYTSRISSNYTLISVAIAAVYFILWKYRFKIKLLTAKFRYCNELLVGGFILGSAVLFLKLPVESLNTDRWSVITSFWDNYFRGEYVYFAKSNVGNFPGPMPFYFIMALPFYLFGELGYFSLFGILMFSLLMRMQKKPRSMTAAYLILILGSLFYLWEVTSRSNILLNGMLVLLSVVYLFRTIARPTVATLLWNGVIIGLFLSIRNVFVIPYIIAFLFLLKFKMITWKKLIVLGSVAVATFFVTFLPFVIGHLDDFMQMNPFIIQSSVLMPVSYTLFCVLLAFGTFFFVKQKADVYFFSGTILFLTTTLHYIHKLTRFDFTKVFFDNAADISYFILCIPFLLFYLIEKEDVTKFQ